jgi:hypothetical protein
MGRPTDYSQELVGTICARMADGESMRSICRDDAMPAKATIFRWLTEKQEFKDQYEIAMEQRSEAMFEEILAIADDGVNDTYQTDDGERTNTDVIARSRLRVDARKWMLSKMIPKKYGERIQTEHSGSMRVVSATELNDDELAAIARSGSK